MTDVIERASQPAKTGDEGGTTDKVARSTPRDDRWPDYFALATFAFAAFVLVVALVPPWRRYFGQPDDALSLLTIPIVPSVVYAALLSVLGVGLRRRLSAAWWVLLLWWLVLPEIGRVIALVAGNDVVLNSIGLVICLAVLVAAFRAKPQFAANRVPGTLWRATAFFVLGGAVVLLGGAWLVLAVGSASSYADSLRYVYGFMLSDLGRLAEEGTPVTAPIWVRAVIGIVGATVVVISATILFRASRDTHSLTVPDEARVRALLRDFGELDSLGYFATRRDKAVVWDTGDPATARAGVSYRVFGSVSLSSGNPVGDPERWAAAIDRWRQEARRNGWSLANMGAGEAGAQALTEAGLVAYEIGDEAIVDLSEFSLNGPGMKAVRQSVSRLQRRGYTTKLLRHSTLTQEDFGDLMDAAGQWRGDGGDERGFSMALGRLEDPLDGDCVMVQARDEEGRMRGFLSFVPWGRNALSLDLMRRDPSAGNGLVELMVTASGRERRRLRGRSASR